MSARTQTCGTCGHAQELPAIFCGGCNSPLLKISKLFLTVFLTVTVSAFVYYGLIQEQVLFAWPLYAFYSLLFVVLSYAVTRRHKLLTARMVAWSGLLLAGMWFFYLGVGRALTALTGDMRDVIDLVERDLFSQVFVGLILLAEAVMALILLAKRFGFATGFRVYMTFAAAAAFAGRFAFAYATGETGAPVSVRLSDWFAWAPQTEVKELFELVAVNIMRAIAAEMAITSFIKAYRPATEAFVKLQPGLKAGTGSGASAGAAMLDAASRLNATLLRAALLLRHFAGQFAHTIAVYLTAFGRTLQRIFLDLVLPAAALFAAALLIGLLTEHSAAYITNRANEKLVYLRGVRSSLAMIGLSVLGLFAVQMLFLASVTKFAARALWRCNALLMMWLAPFVTFMFLFVSLSLIATGYVVNRYDGPDFPYHFGPLTTGSAVLLVVMIVYAAIAAHRAAVRAAERAAEAPELKEEEKAAPVRLEKSAPLPNQLVSATPADASSNQPPAELSLDPHPLTTSPESPEAAPGQ